MHMPLYAEQMKTTRSIKVSTIHAIPFLPCISARRPLAGLLLFLGFERHLIPKLSGFLVCALLLVAQCSHVLHRE